ncbi:MAG: hypothetical protein CMJ13_00350 [Pelagibacterales bacterium]|nr:hypothetical protein [Pelagibacterales bacterium]
MKYILSFLVCFYWSKLNAKQDLSKSLIIKCEETTGTGRSDIFRIHNPYFEWYYKGKWHEIGYSKKGAAKDWIVNFNKNIITLHNKKTNWNRLINLKKMTASMLFPTGEKYLYNCIFIDK